MIGGTGWSKIVLRYEFRRTLTFTLDPGFVAGDIGKPVEGETSGDTGTLLSYDNVAKTCIFEMDDSEDLFDISEVVSVTGGTGTGTTTGASVLVDYDSFTFAVYEQKNIDGKFTKVLDSPDKEMELGNFVRALQGHRFWASLDFRAADDSTNISDLGYSLQTFLRNMHNWTDLVEVTPHLDKASQKYLVKIQNEFDFDSPFDRMYGLEGVEVFRGDEILDIDVEE